MSLAWATDPDVYIAEVAAAVKRFNPKRKQADLDAFVEAHVDEIRREAARPASNPSDFVLGRLPRFDRWMMERKMNARAEKNRAKWADVPVRRGHHPEAGAIEYKTKGGQTYFREAGSTGGFEQSWPSFTSAIVEDK